MQEHQKSIYILVRSNFNNRLAEDRPVAPVLELPNCVGEKISKKGKQQTKHKPEPEQRWIHLFHSGLLLPSPRCCCASPASCASSSSPAATTATRTRLCSGGSRRCCCSSCVSSCCSSAFCPGGLGRRAATTFVVLSVAPAASIACRRWR